MIKPTLGRIVWFKPGKDDRTPSNPDGLCAAFITCVHSDSMVNLCVFDANGHPTPRTSVPLVQDDEEVPVGCYCQWMPYQLGQAARTEAAEQARK